MKRYLLTALLIHIAQSMQSNIPPSLEKNPAWPLIKMCASVEKVEISDIQRFDHAPDDEVSENYKCFIKCTFEATGIFSNGKLRYSRLKNLEERLRAIVVQCDKSVHKDGYNKDNECDYGFKVGRCMSQKSQELVKKRESQDNALKIECANESGFQLSEHKGLKAASFKNATQSFKCYQNCLYEQAQVLQNGRINRAIFQNHLQLKNQLYNHIMECQVEIFEQGHHVKESTPCEFAYQLLLCLEKANNDDDDDDEQEETLW